ncbi:hypothetical protein TRFO_32685 [Tritrichomonas foetus]|uniref:Adenylate and Guanylate cyclase catalytic domain containing protein n=1 Tax=Tritrichomonas foetus TaxID=1144522 RepID=A0A1J4JSZ0_9EUKA|nr:hypothetical protein TRFO_32685 [Tritrichomonas foetus]|eukprot:OHT00620.1 hypothetical protein TRFO_32685 [Tritrichomonas foetus]
MSRVSSFSSSNNRNEARYIQFSKREADYFSFLDLIAKSDYWDISIQFAFVFLCFQIFYMWIEVRNPKTLLEQLAFWLYNIFFITDLDADIKRFEKFAIAHIIIAVYPLIFTAIVFIFFLKKYHIPKFILSYCRFSMDVLNLVFLIPNAYAIRRNIIYMIQSKQTSIIVITVFEFISFAVQFFSLLLSQFVIHSSAYRVIHPLTIMSQLGIYLGTSIPSTFLIIRGFFYFFPSWALIFLHVLEVIFYFYQAKLFISVNILLPVPQATFLSTIISALIMNIILIFVKVSAYMIFVVLSIFIVFFPIFFIYSSRRINHIKKILAYDFEKNLSELEPKQRNIENIPVYDTILERFQGPEYQISESEAGFMLLVGLSNACDLFLDFSIVKHFCVLIGSKKILKTSVLVLGGFPNSILLLHHILKLYARKSDLAISDKFVIFQIQKVMVFRQIESTTTTTSFQQIYETNALSQQLQSTICHAWNIANIGISQTEKVYKIVLQGKSLWKKLFEFYPNSIRAKKDYLRFVIECETDFYKAATISHEIEMYENDLSWVIDECHVGLLKSLPFLIKRKVLTSYGQLIHSKTIAHDFFPGDDHLTTDIIDVESHLKKILSYHKLRYSIFHATKNNHAKTSKKFQKYFYTFYVVYTFLLITAIVLLNRVFNTRNDDLSILNHIMHTRANYSMIVISLLTNFHQHKNIIDFATYYQKYDSSQDLVDFKTYSPEEYVFSFANQYLQSFPKVISDLSMISQEGYKDLDEIFTYMNGDAILYNRCHNGIPVGTFHTTFRSGSSLAILDLLLSQAAPIETWFSNNDHFCSSVLMIPKIGNSFAVIRNATGAWFNLRIRERNIYIIPLIAVPIFITLLGIIFIAKAAFSYLQELKYFMKLLAGYSQDITKEGTLPISLMNNDNNSQFSAGINESLSYTKYYVYIFLILFFGILIFAVYAILGVSSFNINHNELIYRAWNVDKSRLIVRTLDSLCSVMISLLLVYEETNFTTQEEEIALGHLYLNKLKEALTSFVQEEKKEIFEIYPEFDKFFFVETCESNHHNESHACQSLHQQIIYFSSLINNLLMKASTKTIDESYKNSFMDAFHMLFGHLMHNFKKLEDFISVVAKLRMNSYKLELIILFIIIMVLSITNFFICIYINHMLDCSYQGGLILIRRLPPFKMITNHKLVNYILKKQNYNEEEEMTVTQNIMYHSNDMIFYLATDGIIEGINRAVTEHLSYTSDQLIGQHIAYLVSKDDQQDVKNYVTTLLNRTDDTNLQAQVICVTATTQEVHCSLTMFLEESLQYSNKHLVFIFQNITEEIEQKNFAKEMKQRSERLLYNILPKTLVDLFVQGKSNVSMRVPSCSVMFINIARFSDISRNLSPQQIVTLLTTISNRFDEEIQKHPLLTKVKTLGDIYMCASGLFAEQVKPQEHADEIVKYAFNVQMIIDDINLKLNMNLMLRIGIDSGGPVIAGIVSEKLQFDIIGYTVKFASYLEETCLPTRIHISENTYQIMSNSGYIIEPIIINPIKGREGIKTYSILVDESASSVF